VEIIIHQIICGEDDKGGYGLLKSTLSDLKLAKKIAFNTDIQEQTGNYQWISAIRGFVVDDYFLIMKTFPDRSTDVRPGRVFSHVLLIPKSDLINIVNLIPILELLPVEIDKEINVVPIFYKEESNFVTDTSYSYQGRFNKVIHGYVNAQDCSKTIIWVGVENFDTALSLFWKILSVEEKEVLNFGLNFNADAIPKGKFNFINIPENIESKFLNKGYCLVRKNDSYVLTKIFEQLIAGDPKAYERISKFKTKIETGDLSRDAVNNIGKVLNTFENIDTISDLKRLNTLSHVVAEYSPLKDKGVPFKAKLLDKICDLVSFCDVSELHIVKTFKTNSFESSEEKLSQSINKWLENLLFSEKETRTKNYSLLFDKLNGNSNWWTVNIKHQLDVFLLSIDANKALIVMNWLNQDISILDIIESAIDSSSESENSFTIQLNSRYNKSHFQSLQSLALNRKWLKFHAKLMILEYSFEQALSKQLVVDNNDDYFEGINELITNRPPISVISFTINNGDNRLIEVCGEYCHKDNSLLNNIDVSNFYWQEIWVCAINRGNELNDGVLNPIEKVFQLFDLIIDGKEYNKDLIDIISESEFGNILDYPRRNILWERLSEKSIKNFIEKTSSKLLELLSINPTHVVPDDKILSDYIISNGISTFLYYNRNKVRSVLPIFSKYSQLNERVLKDYVYNHSQSIDATDAVQLGRLVQSRRFSSVAEVIYNKSSKHNNWKFALEECNQLLDYFTKALLAISGIISNVKIPTDEWWKSTEDIIVDLYPNGQAIKTIWNNAGGKESDLLINSTGVEVWHDLLIKLRRGFFKDIKMNSLLKEIKKNYYDSNERFKLIYDLRKNYIN